MFACEKSGTERAVSDDGCAARGTQRLELGGHIAHREVVIVLHDAETFEAVLLLSGQRGGELNVVEIGSTKRTHPALSHLCIQSREGFHRLCRLIPAMKVKQVNRSNTEALKTLAHTKLTI